MLTAVFSWLQGRTMLIAILAGGIGSGLAVWEFQEARLNALQAQFNAFVDTAKAEGEAAQKIADAQAKRNQQAKEDSDLEYQSQIDALRADADRMRAERSNRHILPANAAGSGSADAICFSRPKLEQALQRLDDGVSRLVKGCDVDAEGLNVARTWVKTIK